MEAMQIRARGTKDPTRSIKIGGFEAGHGEVKTSSPRHKRGS